MVGGVIVLLEDAQEVVLECLSSFFCCGSWERIRVWLQQTSRMLFAVKGRMGEGPAGAVESTSWDNLGLQWLFSLI